MARCVYFAFHYQRDIWRVNQVRNSNVVEGFDRAGFIDGSLWEEARKKGDTAIKKLIDEGLEGTTVTVVLIGAKTSEREYVEYEIDQSWKKGNGLLGVYIHQLEDRDGKADSKGKNPFDGGYTNIKTYDWVDDNGYDNIGDWVDTAYERAQKRQKK
ncbi:MAG: TIR domain-containing protein [Candidatus Omnitrophica bacterium]|nr:TIR domain-containing protein [Candidatus Omnitrophota bacterium]